MDTAEVVFQKFREQFNPPYGYYVSTVVDGVTVGYSKFPFKEETSAFIFLENEERAIKELRKHASDDMLSRIRVEKQSFFSPEGVRKDFLLVKVTQEGLNCSKEFVKPVVELKKVLSDYLAQWEEIPPEKFVEAEKITPKESWAAVLVRLASKFPLKVVVPLDERYKYSFVVTSIGADAEGKVFAGVRKKLLRSSLDVEKSDVQYPSCGFLISGASCFAVVPVEDFPSIKDAVKELKKAYAKKGVNADIEIKF